MILIIIAANLSIYFEATNNHTTTFNLKVLSRNILNILIIINLLELTQHCFFFQKYFVFIEFTDE